MHELALMQGVLEALKKSARENGVKKITRVKLVVGKMTAALPASLEFCFSVLKKDPLFQEARLEIEEREIQGKCSKCEARFVMDDYQFYCPECGNNNISIMTGRELYIDFYEGD